MRSSFILAGLLLPAALAVGAEPAKLTGAKKPARLTGATPAPIKADPGAEKMGGDPSMMGSSMSGGGAAAISPEHKKFFEDKVQPILVESCYKCHSKTEGKSKGGLTMDTPEALRKGGDGGPPISPSAPEASLMIKAINYKDPDMQMPPKSTGGKLPADKIAILTEWVKMGAPDPRGPAAKAIASKLSGLTDKARGHWAYQPLKKPEVPRVSNAAWCSTPIDAFIMQKLNEKNMVPKPGLMESDEGRETLMRRAYFDLIGLPPKPKEIVQFQKDTSPQAFAKVVERLLASEEYGERWGRFWLDTARYADTVGGDRNANDKDDYRYAYSWTYRDWVIESFNKDMPYDQFVRNQLAADLLPNNDKKNLRALGFLTVGERFNNRNDNINDLIDTVTKGFVGLTVACARCHDHMFDPIPTKDYYALHGIFSSIYEPDELPVLNQPDPKLLKDFEEKVAKYEAEDIQTYYDVLQDAARQFRQKSRAYLQAANLSREGSSEAMLQRREKLIQEEKLDEQIIGFVRGRIGGNEHVWGPLRVFRDLPDGDYDFIGAKKAEEIANQAGKRYNKYVAEKFRGLKPTKIEDIYEIYFGLYENIDSKAEEALKIARNSKKGETVSIDRDMLELAGGVFAAPMASELSTEKLKNYVEGFPLRFRNRGRYNFAAINELKMTHDGSPEKAMVVADRKDPHNSSVFIRGQQTTQGDMVPRGFLEVLSPGGKRVAFTKGSGRLELAEAITSKDCPLTARVLVNRVWLHHFGEGFVRTPDDLGTQSEKPSHPELIEYLAHWFANEGKWSLKNLHRFIMLSKVYQVGSGTVKEYESIDPDNRLLWRANVRRLDFEAMRDSLLEMSGKRDKTIGGQAVNLSDEPFSYRRSVYGYIDRGNMPELMSYFDFSDPHMANSKRTSTIVPQQALFLMNSPFTVDIARAIMRRPEVVNAADNIDRVFEIYKIVYSRRPHGNEVDLAFQFIRKEKDAEPQIAATMKEITDRAVKKVEDRKKRIAERGMNDALGAIRNKGEYIDRKPLDNWETYVQALLMSNEAAYVN
jgi:Protein of unknown function (DUF1553)/Protein of unknown function (DUF1549)/Planctomycete cytochrome C